MNLIFLLVLLIVGGYSARKKSGVFNKNLGIAFCVFIVACIFWPLVQASNSEKLGIPINWNFLILNSLVLTALGIVCYFIGYGTLLLFSKITEKKENKERRNIFGLKTPLRRIAFLIAGVGFIGAICFFFYPLPDSYRYAKAFVLFTTPDDAYLQEHLNEFDSPYDFHADNKTGNFAREANGTMNEIISLENHSCKKVDDICLNSGGGRSQFGYRLFRVHVFRQLENATPYEKNEFLTKLSRDRFVAALELIKANPSYHALGELRNLLACYKNCDCSDEDVSILRYVEIEAQSNILSGNENALDKSDFRGIGYFLNAMQRVYFAEHQGNLEVTALLLSVSTVLLLFALGLFEPIFILLRKLGSLILKGICKIGNCLMRVVNWIRYGK